MKTVARRTLITGAAIVAAGAAATLAGVRLGPIDRLDRAYAAWSLRARVEALAKARMEGDIGEASRFVIASCQPRAPIGAAIRYLSFTVRDMQVEDNVAEVDLGVEYKIDFAGLSSPTDEPQYFDMKQHWVRARRTWYWDPGPLARAGEPLKPVAQGEWKEITGGAFPSPPARGRQGERQ